MTARTRNKRPAKKPSKKTRSNRRINNSRRKIFVSVLTFVVSAVFLFGYLFLNRLNKQFAGAESATSIDQDYFSVLYIKVNDFSSDVPVVEDMEYKVFDKENKKILSVKMLPTDNLYFGERFGEVSVAKLFSTAKLTNSDDMTKTIDYINQEINDLFAFPIDRYVYTDSRKADVWDSVFGAGVYLPFLTDVALSGGKITYYTNFSMDEVYQAANFISALPKDRFVDHNFAGINFANLDDELKEMTLDSNFAHDAKSIAVLNASDKSGLAGQAARKISNLGGRVVSVDNSDAKFDENFIVSDTPDDLTTTVISKVFGISKIISKQEAGQYITTNDMYRADVVLVMAN